MIENLSSHLQTYQNPVYPHSFPDPFVFKFRGEYFAYCTGIWHDGRVFGVLHSKNLVDWTDVGGAMTRLETNSPHYWAPEVNYSNGKFYLYYSVGNEILMELRVAVSNRPDGGFVDSRNRLTTQDFAIDAHVFTDDSGEKYLFYATDFLNYTHVGTGTVVDKLKDFFTPEGKPQPVTRAKYDWQVYDPERKEKGGVRWHTVEGSFVLKRKGIYYQMFSGGNWQNITYGVSFAVTDNIEGNEEWKQFSDGEKVFPILRTIPDLVVGPGHNSVVRGPNNRELYCVYHRWTEGGRVLAIDRMDFAGTRIFIEGASFKERFAPFQPTFSDSFENDSISENWQPFGEWTVSGNEIFNIFAERNELICKHKAESFLCEFSLRAVEMLNEMSSFGFCLFDDTEKHFELLLLPFLKKVAVVWFEKGKAKRQSFDLPEDFDFQEIHLLRVEVDGFLVKIKIDEASLNFEKLMERKTKRIALFTGNMQAAFSGFALTESFEDLFEWGKSEFEKRDWENLTQEGEIILEKGELICHNENEAETLITKGNFVKNFEYDVNLRLREIFDETSNFGFLLLNQNNEQILRISFIKENEIYFVTDGNSFKFALPENFGIENYHQFQFLKIDGRLIIRLEGLNLGEIEIADIDLRVGIFCRKSAIAVEMVRLTVL